MNTIEQQFFNDLEKKLWTAADKLRSSLDASVYPTGTHDESIEALLLALMETS